MSRTYKKEKSAGTEYWSDRPGNKGGSTPGAFTKKLTHKKERKQSKINPRFITEEEE